ncbi:MAG: alpha/beta fold hydrolase [Planctomycetes bacterium]|nr:alpha/beta fold hydrolase [Planctomycetota bacterium]
MTCSVRPLQPFLCTLFGCLFAAAATAQADRYELGLRLRDFERALAAAPAGTEAERGRRDAAFAILDRAVQAFFRLDSPAVAQAIDGAAVALRGTVLAPGEGAARALQLECGPRLVAAGTAVAPITLRAAYASPEPPRGLSVEVWIDEADGARAGASLEPLAEGERSVTFDLPLDTVPPGDHRLRWVVRAGATALLERQQGLSVAADLEPRLAALAAPAAAPDGGRTLEALTLAAHRKVLAALQRRRSEETVLPAARLLDEAEALAALPAGGRYYGPARPGEFWLQVPVGTGAAAVRLFVPELPEGERRPLVLALHGAGGSENLFFDGYGDGEVVRQCAARGWFCVAPRLGFGGADLTGLVAALAQRWPVDEAKVLLVGHSMGAAQAVAAAMRAPGSHRAVAALGGSGNVRRGVELGATRFFVAAGSRDFARGGAQALHRALLDAGARSTWREYPGVEHLAIVQIALPDVFVGFDRALAER